jgi:hypothetical protein
MKRFTETTKWEDPWFRKLPPHLKLLWQWLLDRCDHAGVIDPDIELASFQVGYPFPDGVLSEIQGRIIELTSGKFYIPKFIEYQYGKLSRECKAHNPVFASIEKHGIERVSIGYPKGINTLQDKDKDTDKDKDEDKDEDEVLPFGLGVREPTPLCTIEQAKTYAPSVRFSEAEAEKWWHTRNASGWTKGSANGGNARPITSWQSDMATSSAWVKQASGYGAKAKSQNFAGIVENLEIPV